MKFISALLFFIAGIYTIFEGGSTLFVECYPFWSSFIWILLGLLYLLAALGTWSGGSDADFKQTAVGILLFALVAYLIVHFGTGEPTRECVKKARYEKTLEDKSEKTEKLLARLKETSETDIESRYRLYKELFSLNPNSTEYTKEIQKYEKLFEAKRLEEEQIKREVEIKQLLVDIKKISSNDFKSLSDAYKRLGKLDPKNKTYSSKIKYYDAQYKKEQARIIREKNKKETRKILVEIEKINLNTVADYINQRDLYAKIVKLNPGDTQYASKYERSKKTVEIFKNEIKEKKNQAKSLEQERVRMYGQRPVMKAKAYSEVRSYLLSEKGYRSIESLECSTVYLHDEGWRVKCSYITQNSEDMLKRGTKWYIIKNSVVIKELRSSTFAD